MRGERGIHPVEPDSCERATIDATRWNRKVNLETHGAGCRRVRCPAACSVPRRPEQSGESTFMPAHKATGRLLCAHARKHEKEFAMAEKSQRGSNLTREHRERGGRQSAAKQQRDSRGQFAGTRKSNGGGSTSSGSGGSNASNRGRSSHEQHQARPADDQEPSTDSRGLGEHRRERHGEGGHNGGR